jgi:hypothetical protein
MTEPRNFHLGDVLTITTGRLVSPDHIGGVYNILDFMTGDNLFTHQLPRASDECRPALLAQHPQLREVEVPEEFDDKEHVDRWLAEQTERYGTELPVAPLDPADHTRIHPLEEMGMRGVPANRVIPVVIENSEENQP